jgi:hypothetical protein
VLAEALARLPAAARVYLCDGHAAVSQPRRHRARLADVGCGVMVSYTDAPVRNVVVTGGFPVGDTRHQGVQFRSAFRCSSVYVSGISTGASWPSAQHMAAKNDHGERVGQLNHRPSWAAPVAAGFSSRFCLPGCR